MNIRRSHVLLVIAGAIVLAGAVIFWTLPRSTVQVAAGQIGSGTWTAWAYDSLSGRCLEIRAAGRDDSRLCGSTPDPINIWKPDAPGGEEQFVAGTTSDREARRARVTPVGGSPIEVEVTWPDEASMLGYFVVSLPASATAGQVDLLASNGDVIETTSVN